MSTRGALTLVFDDGYTDVYTQVVPLLEKYKVRAVFAVPLSPDFGIIEQEHIENGKAWQDVSKKYGHEIAAHGISHRNLTTLSRDELVEELARPAQDLKTTTLVYPGGAYNDTVLQEAKKTYTAARTVRFGLETLPPKKPFELHTINYTKGNFSVMRANIYSLIALAQNKWLIETFHMVRTKNSPLKHFVSLSDLDAHLDFITSLPLSIAPIREIINQYGK